MSIEKIISKYKKVKGKAFKERMGAFEKFHSPDNIEKQQLIHHAEYVVMGKPSDRGKMPGAYEKAHQALDSAVKSDEDKVNTDIIANTLEIYVDEFLRNVLGKKFKEFAEHAKAEGLDAKTIRHLKGNMFAKFTQYGEGRGQIRGVGNILNEEYIKKLKGKKKIELIQQLRDLAGKTRDMYGLYLLNELWEGTFNIYDQIDMAKYIKPKFESAGLSHKEHPLTRDQDELMQHYELFLIGDTKELVEKHGYKYKPKTK